MVKAFNFIFLLPFQLEVKQLLKVSLMLSKLLVNFTVLVVLFSVTSEMQRLEQSLLIVSKQLQILLLINWLPSLQILSIPMQQLLILNQLLVSQFQLLLESTSVTLKSAFLKDTLLLDLMSLQHSGNKFLILSQPGNKLEKTKLWRIYIEYIIIK